MATNVVSQEQDVIALEVQIAAPPDRVFQAITDPTQLLRWWGQRGVYHGTNWYADLRPGGQWRCDGVSDTEQFSELSRLLCDQAELAEGGQLPNPADYVQRLNRLLVRLAGA